MELSGNALTTLEEAKSFLGIDSGDTSQDDLLKFFINSASDFIEQTCSRKFGKVEISENVDGTSTQSLLLSRFPIIGITSITSDGILVDSAEYKIYSESGKVFRDKGWSFGNQNIAVVYTAGYVLPKDADPDADPPVVRSLPFDLEVACLKLVGAALNKKEAEGVKNGSAGNLSINFGDGIDKAVLTILNNYKTYHV